MKRHESTPWLMWDVRLATCLRCRATAPLSTKNHPRKVAKRAFKLEHKGCLPPPPGNHILPPGPVPDEPLIDGGLTVRGILGHAIIGGTHLSRLPTSSTPGRR